MNMTQPTIYRVGGYRKEFPTMDAAIACANRVAERCNVILGVEADEPRDRAGYTYAEALSLAEFEQRTDREAEEYYQGFYHNGGMDEYDPLTQTWGV